ncbi:MAG: hypothetical protein AMXMBFR84_10700 [Candidatus Hydrogenedentota bacterium]
MTRKIGTHWKWICAVVTVALIGPVETTYGQVEGNSTMIHAGAASATVNPPMGSFIAGDARNRRFTSVHDDLFAKAVVFSDEQSAAALVVVDCIGLSYTTVQEIRRRASEKVTSMTLPPERVVVSSTHTHSGPDVVGIWGPDEMHSGVDPAYMKFLVESASDQVRSAAESMRPVTLQYATTQYPGEWVHNICEPGVLDRSVTSLQCLDSAGSNVVTITNFACHPTVFDAVHSVVSADYVGGFYRAMAKALPGEHVFVQGAVGGWVQPDKGDRSFPLADTYGGDLAKTVINALTKAQPVEGTRIRFASKKVTFPVQNEGWKMLSQAGVIEREVGDTVESEVVWFAVGSAQFATHPGETPPAYSFATKEWMPTEPKFVIGLGLDALGYILKPEYFTDGSLPHAEYLTSMSLGPETGPVLLSALESIINR